jgi:hydrophobe/amphiphile efflux-3 (HAE3) family protein
VCADLEKNLMKKVIDFAFKHWKLIVGAGSLLTIIFAFFILQVKIENSLETLTIDDDTPLILLQQMEKDYGGNEFVVVSFKGNDIFSPQVLAMIERMTTMIEGIKNVERVLSLTNALTVKGDASGFGVYPLLPETSEQLKEPEELKRKVIVNKMYKDLLFSDDGKSTSIIAWILPLGKDDAARWEVVNAIQEIIDKEKDNRKFYLYGMPVYQKAIMDAMLRDQFYLTPVVFVLVGFLLFFFFRDIRLVIIPFILISLCALWAIGVLTMAGNTMNYVTNIIPIVLLIICICDSVHIMAHYKEINRGYDDSKDALKDVIIQIGIPIMLTSITTSVGFFSLGLSNIKPVRDFGVYTGLGVLFAFGVSITILPLIMSVLNLKKDKSGQEASFKVMETMLSGIGGFVHRSKGLILALGVVTVIISVIGITRIEARQAIIDMLKDNTELDEARKFIDVELGGSCEFDVLFEGKEANAVIDPSSLKLIEKIQHRLLTERFETRKAISVVDFVKEMNQALNGGDPKYYRIPATKKKVLQLLLLYSLNEDQADIKSVLNDDYSQARIRNFTLSADDSVIAREAFDSLEKIISEEIKETELKVGFTGRPKVFLNMVDSLITGMVKSFSFAFVVILIMMIVVFRSIRLGILSMIVNIIPAVLTFGIMGWLNIPLNMMTAMVPSVAIGIAVDDTIHLMWRIKKEIEFDGNYKEAILRSLKSVGKPIITTSILICVGFAAFYFSELTLLTQFAFITLTTVLGALIADLFLAPALLLVFKPIKAKS